MKTTEIKVKDSVLITDKSSIYKGKTGTIKKVNKKDLAVLVDGKTAKVSKRGVVVQDNEFPAKINSFLNKFPDDATSWKQATDEVRDISRVARETYNEETLNVSHEDKKAMKSLNFNSFTTPSKWNTEGKKFIKKA